MFNTPTPTTATITFQEIKTEKLNNLINVLPGDIIRINNNGYSSLGRVRDANNNTGLVVLKDWRSFDITNKGTDIFWLGRA